MFASEVQFRITLSISPSNSSARALAEEFDGDIDKVILNWTSDANIPE